MYTKLVMDASLPSLFSGLKITIETPPSAKQYDVYILEFNPTKRYIIDICSYTNGSPIFQLIGDGSETQISYGLSSEKDAYNALCSFLYTHSILPPREPSYTLTSINVVAKESYTLNKPLFFKTPYSTHKALIKDNVYNFLVKIEGTRGESCIEIFVKKKTPSLVAQIYSEEDCSHDGSPVKGTTVDMIKASLQLCHILFGIVKFELNDESNIECDATPVPRKRIKPLSLAHMTILKYGETWYERNFGAYLKNTADQVAYKEGLAALDTPISVSFDDFSDSVSLYSEQAARLKPLYISSSTWSEFLRKVPKENYCELLRWAPAFMDKLMKFNVRDPLWIIDLEQMTNTTLLVFTNNVSCRREGGGRRRVTRNRKRGTRKQKPLFVFSNKFGGNILRL